MQNFKGILVIQKGILLRKTMRSYFPHLSSIHFFLPLIKFVGIKFKHTHIIITTAFNWVQTQKRRGDINNGKCWSETHIMGKTMSSKKFKFRLSRQRNRPGRKEIEWQEISHREKSYCPECRRLSLSPLGNVTAEAELRMRMTQEDIWAIGLGESRWGTLNQGGGKRKLWRQSGTDSVQREEGGERRSNGDLELDYEIHLFYLFSDGLEESLKDLEQKADMKVLKL